VTTLGLHLEFIRARSYIRSRSDVGAWDTTATVSAVRSPATRQHA